MRCLFILTLLAVNLLLTNPSQAGVRDRCQSYAQRVRVEHFKVFGTEFPWWYGIGQLYQESNCRDVISKDGVGSQGLPQVTMSFWAPHLAKAGIPNINSARNQIRAQAFIMKDAHRHRFYELWVSYQIYNGGRLVLKEIKRAGGLLSWEAARAECRRRDITFSSGQVISACEINYDYPKKIEEYGDLYRIGPDSRRYPLW